MDSKNQDNQLYYVDIIIFRVTRVQKKPQKFPPQVEHEEQAEGGRGTRHPSGDGRLQPALKANVQKHISSKHYDIIGLQNPLEQARGRGGLSSLSLFSRSNSFQLPAHFHLLPCVLISSAWQFTVDLASSESSGGGGGESSGNGMKCHSVVAFVTKDAKRR